MQGILIIFNLTPVLQLPWWLSPNISPSSSYWFFFWLLLLICKPSIQSINGIDMSMCACILGMDNLSLTTLPEKGESPSQALIRSKL